MSQTTKKYLHGYNSDNIKKLKFYIYDGTGYFCSCNRPFGRSSKKTCMCYYKSNCSCRKDARSRWGGCSKSSYVSVHKCICHIKHTKSKLFTCLALKHLCSCNNTDRKCRAYKHNCSCNTESSDLCLSENNHKCSCNKSMKDCLAQLHRCSCRTSPGCRHIGFHGCSCREYGVNTCKFSTGGSAWYKDHWCTCISDTKDCRARNDDHRCLCGKFNKYDVTRCKYIRHRCLCTSRCNCVLQVRRDCTTKELLITLDTKLIKDIINIVAGYTDEVCV